MNLFRFIPGYSEHIFDEGREPLLFLFIAFMIAFAACRFYTRMARKHGWGSGNVGGVHVHHVVPGVILMVVCGILGFSPLIDAEIAYEIVAIGFGVGAALTLDEFAMIFHLKDVYWSEEGRMSIDALLMGMALAGLLLVGSAPFGIDDETRQQGATTFFAVVGTNVCFAAITFLKKKPFLGTVAVLVPIVGVVGAIRLAKPGSPWAHWFYEPARGRTDRARARREKKLRRASKRFDEGLLGRFERWFSDLVGGAPSTASGVTSDQLALPLERVETLSGEPSSRELSARS
jgi:hypothetical protein